MAVVQKMMEVGKESSEVADFIAAIVTDIKMKKPLAEIALNLPKLVTAVEGYDLLDDELKAAWPAVAGYLVAEVGKALMVKGPDVSPQA